MLIVDKVTKVYEQTKTIALDNVSFNFPNTGLFYIVGPSGSGKSTLLHILGGMDNQYEGQVSFDGMQLNKADEKTLTDYRRYNVGISFQSHELEKEYSLKENIDDSLRINIFKKRMRKEKEKQLMQELEIFNLRKKKVNKMSGGEQGRANLARALSKNANIYLLDEPLNGLNKRLRIKISNLLRKIAKDHLVIVVTHQKDEIIENSNVLSIVDGHLEVQVLTQSKNTKQKTFIYKKRKMKFLFLLRRAIKKTLYNPFRAFCTNLTIMIALVSFGLATLISFGVAKEIESALASNIVDNAIALEKRNYETIGDEKENIDEISFEKLKLIFKDEIYLAGNYYYGPLRNMFPNEFKLIYSIENNSYIIPSLTVETLFNVVSPYEAQVSVRNSNLNYDEVILGLTTNQIKVLFPNSYEHPELIKENITLNLKLENSSWGYDADVLFTVKEIVATSEMKILHPKSDFLNHLVLDELQLLPSDKLESTDTYPWTLKRKSYVVCRNNQKQKFIENFYKDSRFKDYDLISMGEEFPNRFGIIRRINERLDIGDVEKIVRNNNDFYSYSFTSSFYQFGDDGLYAGFDSPFYISTDKASINKLVDDYYQSSNPVLSSFNIKAENVVGGDLAGSMNHQNFVFESLPEEECEDLKDEILISSSLAEVLKYNKNLSNKLHYAYLSETKYENGVYYHKFKAGFLNIRGVKEDQKMKIYQSSFFLTYFGLAHLNNDNAGNYQKALIRFNKTGDELIELKEDLQKKNAEYYLLAIGEKLKENIMPTMDLLKSVLYVFSVFGFLIAVFLLVYTLLLIVVEDKKSIKTKYALGWTKKELVSEYSFLSFMYAIIPGFSSATITYILQFALSSSLASIMNTSDFTASIIPSILVLVISIGIGLITIPFIYLNINNSIEKNTRKKLSPLCLIKNKVKQLIKN